MGPNQAHKSFNFQFSILNELDSLRHVKTTGTTFVFKKVRQICSVGKQSFESFVSSRNSLLIKFLTTIKTWCYSRSNNASKTVNDVV